MRVGRYKHNDGLPLETTVYKLSFSRKTEEFEQTIQGKGCEAKVIQNKICIGQCFSCYAPGTRPRKDLTDKRVKYCDTCKPSLRSWTKVSLNCPGTKHPHVDKLGVGDLQLPVSKVCQRVEIKAYRTHCK